MRVISTTMMRAVGLTLAVYAKAEACEWPDRALTVRECRQRRAVYDEGIRYRQGCGCERDLEKAADCFYMAATNGLVSAMEMIAVCYHNGEGVEKDLAMAVAWQEEAAKHGSAYSQFMMGVYRHSGMGGICDPSEAIWWFRQAAEKGWGDPEFSTRMDESPGCGQDVSLMWLENAAKSGKHHAIYWLACSARNGWGMNRDWRTSLELLGIAAERGCELARFALGREMWNGCGGTRDEGERKMRDAAQEGSVTAALAVEKIDKTGHL